MYLTDDGGHVEYVDPESNQGECNGNGGYWIEGSVNPSGVMVNPDSGLVGAVGIAWDGSFELSIAGATDSNSYGAWTQTWSMSIANSSVQMDLGPVPTASIGPASPEPTRAKPGCWGNGAWAGLMAAARDFLPGPPGSDPAGDLTNKSNQAIIVGSLYQAANAAKWLSPAFDLAADAIPVAGWGLLAYQGGHALYVGGQAMNTSIKQCNGD